ncbi:MAG: hypothetical protein OEZ10_13445 [Gammaproteobacteria bacterium]|nr:hypothetical protein [Gammaproteobacteria bacterium]
MNKQFIGANPVLPVSSVVETAAFYENRLGFNVNIVWQDPAYGVVSRGNAVIEFGEGRKEFAGTGVCIIRVEDADAVYEEWQSRNIEFVGDFAERDYGSKDFRVRDNNGNLLIVGHALHNRDELIRRRNCV